MDDKKLFRVTKNENSGFVLFKYVDGLPSMLGNVEPYKPPPTAELDDLEIRKLWLIIEAQEAKIIELKSMIDSGNATEHKY